MSLKRSPARNLWLLGMLVLMGAAFAAFQFARGARQDIENRQVDLAASRQELENAARLSAALNELDRLTIDEATATRLEILRHLALEKSDYQIDISAKQQRAVGAVGLFLRTMRINAELPYPLALALADRLYNTRKIVIHSLTLGTPAEPKFEDGVTIDIEGTIYGLSKGAQL